MESILMGRKEVKRPGLVQAALDVKITNEEGARALNLSVRQFRRLKARYRKGGGAALVHRLRGRRSNRRLSDEIRERVVALVKTTYAELNDTHLTEKLREDEGLSIGRETVRSIRLSLRITAKRPRRPHQHRSRRLREGREGALVQIDGSPYAWLGDRGPEMALVGAVDDATGRMLGATFRPHEDLHGYATLFHQVFTTWGLPLTFYGDGTNILVRNDDRWTLDEELNGEQNPTHLGRVIEDLGIRYIRARSPQAKGRIENRWSTLQDRLTAEFGLRGISSLEAANAFLPEFLEDFNRRFARSPRDVGSAWRRPPRNLDLVLSCRYHRAVAADNTVTIAAHRNVRGTSSRTIQIPPGPRRRSFHRCQVEIRELLDGRAIVIYNDAVIASQAPTSSFRLAPRGSSGLGGKASSRTRPIQSLIVAQGKTATSPPPKCAQKSLAKHPWRRAFSRRAPRFNTPRGEDISIGQ